MINIAIYGICLEMQKNGPQNTLIALAITTLWFVLAVEEIIMHLVVEPAILHLHAKKKVRLTTVTAMDYDLYFMRSRLMVIELITKNKLNMILVLMYLTNTLAHQNKALFWEVLCVICGLMYIKKQFYENQW